MLGRASARTQYRASFQGTADKLKPPPIHHRPREVANESHRLEERKTDAQMYGNVAMSNVWPSAWDGTILPARIVLGWFLGRL